MPRLDGIDCSHYQAVDWAHVPDLGFVATKATQGTQNIDRTFHANWAAMRARKFGCRVAYHYLDSSDPAAQARFCQSVVGPLQVGETLVLDYEAAGLTADHAVAFLNALELPADHRPLLYAGEYMPGAHDARLAGYPVWMPQYRSSPATTRHLTVWQYSSAARVAGVSGRVDVNMIEDPGLLLNACGYTAPKPPPPPPAPVPPPPRPLPERTTLLLGSKGHEVQVAGFEMAYLLGPGDPGHDELGKEISLATFGLGFLDCVTRLEKFFGWPVTGQLIPGSSWTGLDMAFLARGGIPQP